MRIDPQSQFSKSQFSGPESDLIAAFHQPRPAGAAGAAGPVAALWPRPRHPAMQLLRAVMRLAGPHAELIRHAERPWASVTFSGTRHAITLGFDGEAGTAAGEAFIAALPDHEFTISRQLVADAGVTSMVQETLPYPRMVVEAELLLLEDC